MTEETTQSGAYGEEILSASVDDYLLSLAEGVHEAQQHLNRLRVVARPGQPAISYHLPKVDFELKLSFEIAKNELKTRLPGATKTTDSQIRVRPINPSDQSASSFTAQGASIIKGSFVAVPAEGGKPPPQAKTLVKKLTVEEGEDEEAEFSVAVRTAVGEPLSGIEIQFNIDHDLTHQLNRQNNLDVTLSKNTALQYGIRNTDANGLAVNRLNISKEELLDIRIAVLIDVLGSTETIIYHREPPFSEASFGATRFGMDTFETRQGVGNIF